MDYRKEQKNDFLQTPLWDSRLSLEERLDALVKEMTEDEKSDFVYKFFPLMYGIYPYVHPTDKQNKAMKKAGIVPRKTSVYEIAYKAIIDFLSKQGGVK